MDRYIITLSKLIAIAKKKDNNTCIKNIAIWQHQYDSTD